MQAAFSSIGRLNNIRPIFFYRKTVTSLSINHFSPLVTPSVATPSLTGLSPRQDDQSKEAILENFRQAWHEAMTGKTIPVAQLWQGLEDV